MENEKILSIWYKRPSKLEREVTLTLKNCQDYGYLSTTINKNGQNLTVFYKEDNEPNNYENYEIVEGDAITKVVARKLNVYEHKVPNCSKYEWNFADVDSEGSGRNELSGQMIRERIGYYCMLDLAWDLIPNTIEYNNWLKVLTNLPPFFYARFLYPTGEILEKKFYRTDIYTSLHLFIKGNQIWTGLSTTFVQANVDKYEETFEPTLLEETFENEKNKQEYVNVSLNGVTKTIQKRLLELYQKNGWSLV